jgi:hypothetical protein
VSASILKLWQNKQRHLHCHSVWTSTDREQGTVRRYGQQLDACVVYDNFDYREGVKHQLISNHAEMRSVTTGKVFRGADIPPGGLKKSMLHREVPLTIEDLLYSPGAAEYDETAAKIDTYFISNSSSISKISQFYILRLRHLLPVYASS